MKTILIVLYFLILICACATRCSSHVYVIVYATLNGKTGHAGIAVDNYDIITSGTEEDTVSNGTLTYFDLWPSKDDFGLFSFSKNQEAIYYKLPNGIWSAPITISLLYDQGIPHRESYPADAILKLATRPFQDFALNAHLDGIMEARKIFNPRFYNCTDFVNEAIRFIRGKKLRVKEFIPFSFTATPNKLCRKLIRLSETVVIKSPDSRIDGSFFRERVLERKKRRGAFELAASERSSNNLNF
jgi:hypothetical protein